jgi:PAS domain S-box-containing protein
MSETPPTRLVLQSLLDATAEVALLIDSDGLVVEELRNDSDHELLNYGGEELTGKTLWNALRSSQLEHLRTTIEEVFDCGEARPADIQIGVEGKTRQVAGTVSPVGDGEPRFALLTIEDSVLVIYSAGSSRSLPLVSLS